MKRIFILVSIFIAALTSFAFADDDVKDYVILPDSRVVELPSINASSSIYSIDDVYRILNSWNYPSGSSWIQTKDSALHLDLTTTNNRLNDIKSAINNQDFSQLHSDLSTVNSSITSGNTQNHSDLSTINSSITSGITQNHSDLTTINSSITSGNSQNHTDITSFQDDYNNITWTPWITVSNAAYSDVNLTQSVTAIGNYTSMFFKVTVYSSGLTRAYIPFRPNTYYSVEPNIKFYDRGRELTIPFYYDVRNTGTYVIFDSGNVYGNSNIAIYFNPGSNWYMPSTSISLDRMDPESVDALFVLNLLYQDHIDRDIHHQNKIFDAFKDLYASDDLIAAKQAQQSVEDASISNFTGSGSGAASVSDVNATKNAQKAVKDSLNTGASASNVSNIVGVNSGFFSFFSQSVSDSVNNPSLSRQTRDINNPDYVPDLLSQNEREYWRLINGDNR